MKFGIFDAQGNRISGGSTLAAGGTSPAAGTQPMATYDRMDVGILALQQVYQAKDIYDFRVPGDPNKVTFQYKFPRAGYVLGVSITGTVSQTAQGGIYVTKGDAATGMRTDVMAPTDAGNPQSYDTTNFPSLGKVIMAPSPIAYNAGDVAQMKWVNLENFGLTVNFAGFLIIGLTPQ
jgi:hypothetical protein